MSSVLSPDTKNFLQISVFPSPPFEVKRTTDHFNLIIPFKVSSSEAAAVDNILTSTSTNFNMSLPFHYDEYLDLPIEMKFNQGHLLSIIVYSILFVIAALGNITLLVTIIRIHRRSRLGRVNLFLLHLAIADLMVTFLLMPLEIGWAATVYWRAGDLACRILSFFRTFGLYLSGFLLICISLDRYFAVLQPLTLPEANRRGRIMLRSAWIGSILCSLPQALIFHVERHPKFKWYEQCVTFNSFPSKGYELAYSIFGFIFMYGFPLFMIIFCYTCILYEIFKIHQIHKRGDDIRRSNIGTLGRAKVRTLKMTVVIVLTFVLCWLPYNIISLWYWIDKPSAQRVDQRIQKGLFLFAVTNSCFNPIVYGLFHIRRKIPTGVPNVIINGNIYLNQRNNGRQPYRFRVRWKSQNDCMCSTNPSATTTSSNQNRLLRPMYEINGVPLPVSLNSNGTATSHHRLQSRQFGIGKVGTPVTYEGERERSGTEVILCPLRVNSRKEYLTNETQFISESQTNILLNTTQSIVNLGLRTSPTRTPIYNVSM